MPRYEYWCSKCDDSFSTVHRMTEKLDQCAICESHGTVTIVPSILNTKHHTGKRKPGQLVKQYIKDTKEYVEEQKLDLAKDLKNDY